MGTTVQLAASGVDDEQLARTLAAIEGQARRWTRFADDSELAAVNRAAGRPTIVSPDTAAVIAAAIDAWRSTGGRFDPTVYDALLAAGYDRTFDDGPGPTGPAEPAPGLDDAQVDETAGLVTLPPGVRLDLGGIGKGWAADAAVASLTNAGATTAAASIGGDVRVVGHPDTGWPIQAELWDEPVAWLADGGFCFSTTTKRRWSAQGVSYHHIIDPTTGRPTATPVRHVAVAASTAAVAEVHATAAIVAGWPAARTALEAAELDGFVTTSDGSTHVIGSWTPNPSILAAAADRNDRE